jgi:myo-inositol-1(or 4)-monophosphatase
MRQPTESPSHGSTTRFLQNDDAMDDLLPEAMQVGIEAAQAAGKILCEMLETATAREKAPKDLVTDADVAAQECIEGRILTAFPGHQFLGEECSQPNVIQAMASSIEWLWVVDPLDGTVNYTHKMPNFAVSIALMHRGQTVLGVVLDPTAQELYTAILGRGATVNGRKLQSSSCTKLGSALVAASFPPMVQRDSIEVSQFIDILVHSQSVRRLGSAALNLCYVAQGRLDAYWAGFLKVWDVAAGALIATESGATLTKQDGKPHDCWDGDLIVAGSETLHRELRGRLQAVEA